MQLVLCICCGGLVTLTTQRVSLRSSKVGSMAWVDTHLLKLNGHNTEVIVFTTLSLTAQARITSITICGCDIETSKSVRDLGVTYDSCMNLEGHVDKIRRSVYYLIYPVHRIRKYLTESAARALMQANVTSRLDYCNGLL